MPRFFGRPRHRRYPFQRERLEETFISAADATMNVMVEELNAIEPRKAGTAAETMN
jgi:hypothetical protein